ncbi:MAG: alpha/beta hydrolase [Breznakibacter sp.]
MKSICTLYWAILFFSSMTTVSAQDYIPLWPEGQMPNSRGLGLERIEERERVSQVGMPGLYAFFPSKEENKRSAVLICPPGGYQKLTYVVAGTQLAKWFNTMGVNAFVLMYRLPTSPDLLEPSIAPLQDAQRGMKFIRAHAAGWGIDVDKIGVFGSSAGGHVASSLSTVSADCSSIADSLDRFPFTPDFQILVSPVISMVDHFHRGSHDALLGKDASAALAQRFSNERNVTVRTPPCLMVHAHNDPVVDPLNSINYYVALRENGVRASLHIFPEGGHSIALRNNPGSTAWWAALCEAWLTEMGFL